MNEPRWSKNGQRRVIDPPCEFAHKLQAMECPSCSERIGLGPCPPEHWDWYRKRTNRKRRDNSTLPVSDGRS